MRYIVCLALISLSYAQSVFQNLEGVVGYIVIEKKGKVENYLVVEEKNGSVKTLKVDRKPADFLKRVEEGGKK